MQAINIQTSGLKRKSTTKPLPGGWWIAPAFIISIGIWALIIKLIF